MAALHPCFFFDRRQGEILNSLFGDDGHRRLDDLMTADRGDDGATGLHGRAPDLWSCRTAGPYILDRSSYFWSECPIFSPNSLETSSAKMIRNGKCRGGRFGRPGLHIPSA